ncbi:hypothetical protein IQ07DRAFT_592404 [Pyrenochaeta sp. DS3sAY3a]|nr:hypothetical protein IQ07DRAFT_592404 [Pyrenochaeta sp. DS3sAY3a]
MSVPLATYHPFYNRQCISTCDPLRISARIPSDASVSPAKKNNMFDGLRKTFSKRKSNNINDATWGTSSTGSMSRSTTGGSKHTSSHSGGLSPLPRTNPFTSSSPVIPNRNPFSTPDDAPPAYTATPVPQSNVAAVSSESSDSDEYAFLKSFDTIFLIDDSGSMAGRSWRETAQAIETIAPICTKRDADGIDIFFLNHPATFENVTSASTVVEIFQSVRPSGVTPTGQRLDRILKPYLKRYQRAPNTTKPINIIVITDGVPTDDLESPIIQAAKKLDKLDAPAWQVGIQFFQVGNDKKARDTLKQLDDDIREISGDDDLRDIVDTVPFTGADNAKLTAAGILKVTLGAVNRKLDRNSKELHRA